MPDPTTHPSQPGDSPRGGFEVRVIGGGKPAAAEDESSRERVEIGLQIGVRAPRAEAVPGSQDGPVHRLEAATAAEPLRMRPMSEVGPAEPRARHHHHKGRNLTMWTVWMAVGTCTVAVAAVAGLLATRKNAPAQSGATPDIAFVPEAQFDQEKSYILEHLPTLKRDAEAVLNRYVAARSVPDVLPLVRDADRVKERLEQFWRPWSDGAALDKNTPLEAVTLDSGTRFALVLNGRKGDFTRFQMVFVRDDSQLKLDWEASFGIGEAPFSELRGGTTVVKDSLLRAILKPGNFYTPEFPEKDFCSYQLLDPEQREFVWGFARRESPAAAALNSEFNEGSVLLEKTSEFRATVKISGPLAEGVNVFEITEMLHKGWVRP